MSQDQETTDICNLLTAKQIETLNLLVKHKTSKEIARELGISPHTVDQRIDTAKRRLKASTRGELVQAFLHLRDICHELTYEETHIDRTQNLRLAKTPEPLVVPEPKIDPVRPKTESQVNQVLDYNVGPELFEGIYGTLFRIFAIFGMAAAFSMMIVAVITIYINLSDLVTK